MVIPAFNAQATVLAAVRSALGQTVSDLEVIVVDDGSADGTLDVLNGVVDSRVRVLAQANAGPAATRNAGLALARFDVVAFLDADDLLLPDYAAIVLDVLDADPDVTFVYTDAWTFDDRTRRVREATTTHFVRPPRPAPASARAMLAELIERNFIIIPVAARTAVLRAAGGFDDSLAAAEDWDLWLRLAAGGHRGTEAPGPLGLRREHPRSRPRTTPGCTPGRFRRWTNSAADPRLDAAAKVQVDARREQPAFAPAPLHRRGSDRRLRPANPLADRRGSPAGGLGCAGIRLMSRPHRA